MPTLSEVLKQELAGFRPLSLRTSELDGHVTQTYLSTGAPCSSHAAVFKSWPGPANNVYRWFVLDDGMAIGLLGEPGAPVGVARFPLKIINHIDWNRLRTFMLVQQAGSFTKAGKELGLTQSAVSRQIAALEEDVGSALFIRSNTGLVLTEAGEYFLETVSKIWECLELGLARVHELRDVPSGPLRLTTSIGFGSAWLSSKIHRFRERHPGIQLELLLVDNVELNLQRREADCAIHFHMPSTPNLVQLYIDDFSYRIYGARSYLDKRGIPKDLDDLHNHDLIVYGDGIGTPPIEKINWLLNEGLPDGEMRVPALQINSVYGIYRAVESGVGLAALPFYMSERSDELVEVLSNVEGPRIPLYFVYAEELRHSLRINLLRDFILEEIRKSWPRPDDKSDA